MMGGGAEEGGLYLIKGILAWCVEMEKPTGLVGFFCLHG